MAFKYHEGLIDHSYPVNGALGYKYFQKESYEVPPAYLPGKFLIFSLLYYKYCFRLLKTFSVVYMTYIGMTTLVKQILVEPTEWILLFLFS